MGIDINAVLMVGLPITELKIEEMPLYDKFVAEEVYDSDDFAALIHEFYYFNKSVQGLTATSVHHDFFHDERTIVGFEVLKSPSWDTTEVSIGDLLQEIEDASFKFYKMLNRSPNIYLMPEYW